MYQTFMPRLYVPKQKVTYTLFKIKKYIKPYDVKYALEDNLECENWMKKIKEKTISQQHF